MLTGLHPVSDAAHFLLVMHLYSDAAHFLLVMQAVGGGTADAWSPPKPQRNECTCTQAGMHAHSMCWNGGVQAPIPHQAHLQAHPNSQRSSPEKWHDYPCSLIGNPNTRPSLFWIAYSHSMTDISPMLRHGTAILIYLFIVLVA